MKSILVGISLVFSALSYSQQAVRTYTLTELNQANPDSVFSIDLSREKLTTIPSIVYRFTKIKTLNLSKNKIELLGDSILVFKYLETLNLRKNKMYSIPFAIFQLSSLKHLLLAENHIERIPNEIEQLIALETLDLYDNAVNFISPQLKTLLNLKILDIQGVMYNHEFHKQLVIDFKHCTLYLDPPCSCMDWIINNSL